MEVCKEIEPFFKTFHFLYWYELHGTTCDRGILLIGQVSGRLLLELLQQQSAGDFASLENSASGYRHSCVRSKRHHRVSHTRPRKHGNNKDGTSPPLPEPSDTHFCNKILLLQHAVCSLLTVLKQSLLLQLPYSRHFTVCWIFFPSPSPHTSGPLSV